MRTRAGSLGGGFTPDAARQSGNLGASGELSCGRNSLPRNMVVLLDSKRSSNVEIMLRATKQPLPAILAVRPLSART